MPSRVSLLSEVLRPRMRFTRSANLERDVHLAAVAREYIPTRRALEALGRVIEALGDPQQPKSWSLTGPYGAGKSVFALFLTSLLSSESSDSYAAALGTLATASSDMAREIERTRELLRVKETGFAVAAATAQKEPITSTLARAMRNGVQSLPRLQSAARAHVDAALNDSLNGNPYGVIAACRALADVAPVLLLVDEFGKNLEYAAEQPLTGDLYVLQQLAEALTGPVAIRGCMLTFQHLSFADYGDGLSRTQRQEWHKVQGRFEEIPFLESHEQTLELIEGSIVVEDDSGKLQSAVATWSRSCALECSRLGLTGLVPKDPERIAKAYPLHPLLVASLPDLTGRYGQNDRSLFGFLCGDAPYSVRWFAAECAYSLEHLPVLGLEQAYDYFIGELTPTATSSDRQARLIEIRGIVEEAGSRHASEISVLKSIAVLNLVSSGGPLRASESVLRFAFSGQDDISIPAILKRLSDASLVTYRRFADEYRLWQGSDFDIETALAAARDNLADLDLAEHLRRAVPIPPKVAQRHYQETGNLRHFECRYQDVSAHKDMRDGTAADGLVLYLVGEPDRDLEALPQDVGGKPLVAVATPDLPRLREAALDAAALTRVLNTSDHLRCDRVALREVRQRAAAAQERLRARITRAFDPTRDDLAWFARGRQTQVAGPAGLSALISDLCNEAYSMGPVLQNEMLNRHQLTSQGARARRQLIAAIVENPDLDKLGLTGFGPEASMYESVLRATGMHSPTSSGAWRLSPPESSSGLLRVWEAIEDYLLSAHGGRSLEGLYRILAAPPYGMREGPIPVLLTIALSIWADQIALYQDGSFEPRLSVELAERLVKAPERFTARNVDSPERQPVIEALETELGSAQLGQAQLRNSSLLAVLRPMIAVIRGLPQYSLYTQSISSTAQNVRAALLQMKDVDSLLFVELPAACGLESFELAGKSAYERASDFATTLHAALVELESAYENLIDRIIAATGDAFRLGDGVEQLREALRERLRPLEDVAAEPTLRSLVVTTLNSNFSSKAWLESLSMLLTGKSPTLWRDEDFESYLQGLEDLRSRLARVEMLRAQSGAATGVSVDVRRLTLTRSNGCESSLLVQIPEALSEELQASLEQLQALLSSQRSRIDQETLVAMLLEKIATNENGRNGKEG